MAYTQEIYLEDKAAVDGARDVLSALVVGEKVGQTKEFGPYYARIANYFNGLMVRRVARTFLTIATGERISGFECGEFSRTLDAVDKMLKSKRTFFRKPGKKCLKPKLHGPGCMCARLAKAKANMDEPMKPTDVLTSSVSMLDAEEAKLRRELLETIE